MRAGKEAARLDTEPVKDEDKTAISLKMMNGRVKAI